MAVEKVMQEDERHVSRFMASIDDETLAHLMEYYHFEDYDALVRYAQKFRIRLPVARNREL